MILNLSIIPPQIVMSRLLRPPGVKLSICFILLTLQWAVNLQRTMESKFIRDYSQTLLDQA